MLSAQHARYAAMGIMLIFASAISHADSPAPQRAYIKPVGDRGEHVFVMLPGYQTFQRRKVPVSCGADAELSKLSPKTPAIDQTPAAKPPCAANERASGGTRRGGRCEIYCEGRRWQYRDSKGVGAGAGYPASGLYHRDDKSKPVWTVSWYTHSVYLSDDGRYLVRMGPWASRDNDLAVAFYDRGELLTQYLVKDLVADIESLPRSVSHFEWRRKVRFDAHTRQLFIATLNDEVLLFDITSGKTLARSSPPAPSYSATITSRDGKAVAVSNVTLCGGVPLMIGQMQSGRSAAFTFYGFIKKPSNGDTKGSGMMEMYEVPFDAIRTISHIGHDVSVENDLWLVELKSGQVLTLSTDIDSFWFCGDIGSNSGERIRSESVKTIAFK